LQRKERNVLFKVGILRKGKKASKANSAGKKSKAATMSSNSSDAHNVFFPLSEAEIIPLPSLLFAREGTTWPAAEIFYQRKQQK
jgi:hypothetical protein